MDKIEYTNKDINFLLEWRDKNKELVRMGFCPIKAIKILSIENGITLTCIVTAQPPPLYQTTKKREIICLGKNTPINSNGVLWSSLEREKQVVT